MATLVTASISLIDQSQNTGSAILVKDDGANELFKLDEDGQLTFGTVAGTTAITITDTDYTNALSIGDNNIIGTTYTITGTAAAIDFSEFDVSAANGGVTINDDADAGYILVEGTNLDINSLDFVGAGAITTAAAADLTINSGTTGTINIGTDASAEIINIGNTGAAVKTVHIGDSAQANLVTVGSLVGAAALTLQSGTGDLAITSADGVTMGFSAGDMVVTGTGASADFTLDADLISIDATGTTNFSLTGAAGEDLTISQLGAADASLFLSSTGTAEDALGISTSAGGINITVAGAAAGEDLDLLANSSINLTSTEGVADALVLTSTNGGIDIITTGAAATEDIDVTSSASPT